MVNDCSFLNNPSTDSKNLPLLGTILSYGFLTCGVLPIKMAFPIIAAVVHGPIIESFFDFLCAYAYDSSVINDGIVKAQQCLSFTTVLQTQLINVLSRLGCVDVPTPTNIKQLVIKVARHLLSGKCLGQLYTMASGVPIPHVEFWKKLTIEQPTPRKVLAIIEEPEDMNMAQTKAFSFLIFFANSNPDDLRLLLRFITGSSVMIDFPIKVIILQDLEDVLLLTHVTVQLNFLRRM